MSDTEEARFAAQRRRKLMLSYVLGGISLALLIGYVLREKKRRNRALGEPMANLMRPEQVAPEYTEEELLGLAKSVKEAGLKVMGVSQCGWTKKQRELFGGSNSEARKAFESVYVECRSREMCPNVTGYPTWVHEDNTFPGFRGVEGILELIKSLPKASEEPEDPKEEPKIVEIKQEPKIVEIKEEPKIVEIKEEEQKSEEAPPKEQQDKKEHVRGVSGYAPLNVPNMPGTAPMATDFSHAAEQWFQGNKPRFAASDPKATSELSMQMNKTLEQIAHDASKRRGDGYYATGSLPHSANITTGNPMENNKV